MGKELTVMTVVITHFPARTNLVQIISVSLSSTATPTWIIPVKTTLTTPSTTLWEIPVKITSTTPSTSPATTTKLIPGYT